MDYAHSQSLLHKLKEKQENKGSFTWKIFSLMIALGHLKVRHYYLEDLFFDQ